MGEPDSQQRSLAGEYYVASIISRLGYDVGIKIGRAKIFDMIAQATSSGKVANIQVKATHYYDWLVHDLDPSANSVVALVRFGKDATQKPELYFLSGKEANNLKIKPYPKHAPRIKRAEVLEKGFQDHDFSLIKQLLGD